MKIVYHSKISRRYTTLLRESYIRSNPLLHGDGLTLMKEFGILMLSAIVWLFISYFIILEMLQEQETIDFAFLLKETRYILSIILFSIFTLGVYLKVYEFIVERLEVIMPVLTRDGEEFAEECIDWF